jgi:hypothetical protein
MKKLTSLQILMLMGLAIGSSQIYGDAMQDEAMQHHLKALDYDAANDDVIKDLTNLSPAVVEQIIRDEKDLESNFASIRNFIEKKNKEIEELLEKEAVKETDLARLAVELADAYAKNAEYVAENRADKKSVDREGNIKKSILKKEQELKDALHQAGRGVRQLSKKAVISFHDFTSYTSDVANKFAKKVMGSSKKKSNGKKLKLADESMMNDEMIDESDDIVVQYKSTPKPQ